MSMTKLIIGTAIGFLLAQGLLHVVGRLLAWLGRGELMARARAAYATPEHTVLAALVKYAAPVGIGAAVITLGIWAVNDYLATRSALNEADLLESSAPAPGAAQRPQRVQSATLTPAPALEAVAETADTAPDPYADPAFKVRPKPHRANGASSLKETLVRQSEARARSALLRELEQHVNRSQYDCEAADRAGKYLKAGLDVWGFASWQVKYFPLDNYRGATLERCRGIKSLTASAVDLQSAVAQQSQPDAER